jgi:hypothetical protein
MPVKPHIKIVVRGVFLNSPEIWSYSLKFTKDADLSRDADVTDISTDEVTSALDAFHRNPLFQSNVKVTEWRAYDIGSTNKMVGNPLLVDVFANNIVGTGSARNYPTDVALCVSTVGADRGHARFGRFYLPGPHSGLDAGRQIPVSDVSAMLTAVTAFLKDVSDQIDIPDSPLASSSMVNISNDAAATHQLVDHIRIGRVFDHIGRRRNALKEEYVESGHIDW